MERILMSGAFKSSYSTYLLAMADTGFNIAGYDAPFGRNARTTGLASNMVSGTVPFAMADSFIRFGIEAIQSTIQADDPWSQKDLRDAKKLTLFGNLPVINQASDIAISNLPLPVDDN